MIKSVGGYDDNIIKKVATKTEQCSGRNQSSGRSGCGAEGNRSLRNCRPKMERVRISNGNMEKDVPDLMGNVKMIDMRVLRKLK